MEGKSKVARIPRGLKAVGGQDLPSRAYTPWGMSDGSRKIANGIRFYETPSHGGAHLSEERQAAMPEALRTDDGWYEEDVDYNRIILGFPQYFSEKERAEAKESLKHWAPESYEAFYHETIPEGQSHIKDDRIRAERNRGNFVAKAAWGDWQRGVPKGDILVLAKRESDGTQEWFLVPQGEYRASPSFVIDPRKHQRYTGPKP